MENNKTTYLIFNLGFEGIDKVTFPTSDPEKAAEKLLSIRNGITEAKRKREEAGTRCKLDKNHDDYDDELEEVWSQMHKDNEITYQEFTDAIFGNPNSWCVQKWNGERFDCCCKELGVEPDENWFY